MIRFFFLFIGVSFFSFSNGAKAQGVSNRPVVEAFELTRAFIPVGFDDNDQIQIMVAGVLPDTCHEVGDTKFEALSDGTLGITQFVYRYDRACLRMVIPFTKAVNLGVQRHGIYTVVDGTTGKKLGSLPVDVPKNPGPGSDDYLYAPINDAMVEKQGKVKVATLYGTFTHRCMRLKEVQQNWYGNVGVVLPISEIIGDGKKCPDRPSRFNYSFKLSENAPDSFMLHVRSLNGSAINKFFELGD